MSFEKLFIADLLKRLRYYKHLGEEAMAQLNEEEFNYRPNEESNSLAMIVQHMHGNMMSRFTNFLTEDGEKSWRNRDAEFETQNLSRDEILGLWKEGWDMVFNVIESLEEKDLMKEITIRTEKLHVFDALLRQLAHYPHHIGQILYIGKMLKGSGWKNLSIPKGESLSYNKGVIGLK